jgi:hypothetical protein
MKDYIKVLKMGEMCLINNRKVKKGIEFATTDRMSEEEAFYLKLIIIQVINIRQFGI